MINARSGSSASFWPEAAETVRNEKVVAFVSVMKMYAEEIPESRFSKEDMLEMHKHFEWLVVSKLLGALPTRQRELRRADFVDYAPPEKASVLGLGSWSDLKGKAWGKARAAFASAPAAAPAAADAQAASDVVEYSEKISEGVNALVREMITGKFKDNVKEKVADIVLEKMRE